MWVLERLSDLLDSLSEEELPVRDLFRESRLSTAEVDEYLEANNRIASSITESSFSNDSNEFLRAFFMSSVSEMGSSGKDRFDRVFRREIFSEIENGGELK